MKKKKTISEHIPDFNEFVPNSVPLSVQQLLQMAIKRFQAGDLIQAEKLCRQVLQMDSNNADANHLLGIMASKTGKKDEAIELLSRAILSNPNNAEIHKNLGQIFNSIGRQGAAIDCFRKAILLNPDYAEAYNNLGLVLKNTGKLDEAIDSFRKAILISSDFAEVHNNLGNAFLDSNRIDEAIDSFRKALVLIPDFAMAYYNLGAAYHKKDRIDNAIACYKKSLSLNPSNIEAFNTLGTILHESGRTEEAIVCFEKALSLDPDFARVYNNLGLVFREQGKMDEAIVNFRKVIFLEPDYAEAYLNLGMVFKELGHIDNAISSFEMTLSKKPDNIGALYNLALAVKYTEMCDFIYRLEELHKKEELSDDDLMKLGFALGKVYEDIKEYDKAFSYILEANRRKRETFEYSIQTNQKQVNEIKKIFTSELFLKHTETGNYDGTPILIIGMPRSGTTLTEQILASHPQVHGAGELKILRNIAWSSCPPFLTEQPLEYLAELDVDEFERLGAEYINGIRNFSNDAKYIVDKLPHNFLFVGLIRLILPKAKVVHCTRDPMDNCLSLFKNNFLGGHEYSYDMVELGQYYKLYLDLMKHWEKVLPGFICDLKYEELVADQKEQTRRLLDFCGLDWDDSCLVFHETERIVKTASYAQVRMPIYKDSVKLWKRYELHLEPLRKIVLG